MGEVKKAGHLMMIVVDVFPLADKSLSGGWC